MLGIRIILMDGAINNIIYNIITINNDKTTIRILNIDSVAKTVKII